ncbi:response regulator transcription factor [Acidaminobacter sp. JC074]|uniref:response regulator transcription factor n=1 Tax=Acidaminobacter sp. JC074 TaxID=2530199 RepID=UPI001F0F86E5|nr:response regulator transcription factor [Acidaminobacter sp. JC074]MCH4889372.1 response regulator transcription factor [Acidaminobacter sp. JC074]
MKILIVDDDKKIVSMIEDFMKINNIETMSCYNGKDALELSKDPSIELIILDINMTDMTGFEVCKEIRKTTHVPIIFLTAKTTQADKILGLGIGADDYITKPFDPLELVARVKSHIRRYQIYDNEKLDTVEIRDLTINKKTHEVTLKDQAIELSSTEYALLLYLSENRNRILTRQELLTKVWKSHIYTENTVNMYIMRLRDKIEIHKTEPEYLITIRGEGYVFK